MGFRTTRELSKKIRLCYAVGEEGIIQNFVRKKLLIGRMGDMQMNHRAVCGRRVVAEFYAKKTSLAAGYEMYAMKSKEKITGMKRRADQFLHFFARKKLLLKRIAADRMNLNREGRSKYVCGFCVKESLSIGIVCEYTKERE